MTASNEPKIWGLHSQDERLLIEKGVVALGWRELGDLSGFPDDREVFKAHFAQIYPHAKKGQIPTSAGMLYRFIHEAQVGDFVVFPSKTSRLIHLGIIEGGYSYDHVALEYVHQRQVRWVNKLPRTAFSQGALYEIGSFLSFFLVKNYADEFLAAFDKNFKPFSAETEDETIGATAEEIVESTKDFILKELSKHLKGYELEEFVADLLRVMGYRTTVSAKGGDSGIDIVAYKDELPPRILVQVKSGQGDITEATIQSLKGAMREGDYGLFVTLADYKKKAARYLEATPIIRGINGTELVELILKYYEDLDDKYQRLIPLKRFISPYL